MQLSDNRNVVNSSRTSSATGAGGFARPGWRELRAVLLHPWTKAPAWPWVRWLSPVETVALIGSDGEHQAWEARLDGRLARATPGAKETGRGRAMALPPEIVLHRSMTLPTLGQTQVRRAVELEALASSPFAAQDLCWGCATKVANAGKALQVQLVMASHDQITRYLQDKAAWLQADASPPEIWAPLTDASSGYVLMPGYGETARHTRQRKGRALHLLLLGALVLVLACIAVTPTLQLRSRAIEAVHAYDGLHQRASQAVASREALVRATERIAQIEGLERASTPPARIIDSLSSALGDDTYLTALRIEGAKVTLDGQTTNAAQLMQALGRQPGIQEVTAPVPATRPFGSGKDIFKIEFHFDPAVFARGDEPATQAAAGAAPVPGAAK